MVRIYTIPIIEVSRLRTLGLCIGSSNINLVLLTMESSNNIEIIQVNTMPHEGNPRNDRGGSLCQHSNDKLSQERDTRYLYT